MPTHARVLVIEDGRSNRELLLTVLRRLGYDADGAESGEAGLIALDAHPYDLVMLDLRLPGLPGDDVARTIRARPGPQPLLALLSAEHDLHRHPAAALCNALLPKPIDWTALTTLLRQLLPPPA